MIRREFGDKVLHREDEIDTQKTTKYWPWGAHHANLTEGSIKLNWTDIDGNSQQNTFHVGPTREGFDVILHVEDPKADSGDRLEFGGADKYGSRHILKEPASKSESGSLS